MGRGVHNIGNKKFLLILLSWKEKKKKSQRPKKWLEFLVVTSPALYWSRIARQRSAPEQAVRNENMRRDNKIAQGLQSLFVSSQQTSTTTPNDGKIFFFYARTRFLFAADKRLRKKSRHESRFERRCFVLKMFPNYHKTSEPNNNK